MHVDRQTSLRHRGAEPKSSTSGDAQGGDGIPPGGDACRRHARCGDCQDREQADRERMTPPDVSPDEHDVEQSRHRGAGSGTRHRRTSDLHHHEREQLSCRRAENPAPPKSRRRECKPATVVSQERSPHDDVLGRSTSMMTRLTGPTHPGSMIKTSPSRPSRGAAAAKVPTTGICAPEAGLTAPDSPQLLPPARLLRQRGEGLPVQRAPSACPTPLSLSQRR